MLFKNLAPELSADVLGDSTMQGVEIAGADCNCSWPITEWHWQEPRGGFSYALWESWWRWPREVAARAPF